MNQTEYAKRERGGIQVRDYTKGDYAASQKRGMKLSSVGESVRSGLNPNRFNFDRVARGLVWASMGLGLLEIIMPQRVQKMIGVRMGDYSGLIRALGVREMVHALSIMMGSRPSTGVWSRVAGDAIDLGLLGAAYTTCCADKSRLTTATAAIAGITALDVLTASQLSKIRAEEKRYSALTKEDLKGRTPNGGFIVNKSIFINRSPEELYQYWRNFSNLPRFMYHLESVNVIDDKRSHWVASAPAGTSVSWDAEIVEDWPNQMISWRSTENAMVPNSGRVDFKPHISGRGTVVHVQIEYHPPAGRLGKTVAMLFGEEPTQQIKGDLGRFKQVMETGEVVRSEGSPHGLGQKMQRPARPVSENKEERIPRFGFKREKEREQETFRG